MLKQPQKIPKITFGIIVLNGEPFTRYCLRSLYPFAHEIIVVEGACEAAVNIATSDGHSKDGTLDTLYRFKLEEDPDNKLKILIKEGFWSEKDEQSQAYAQEATGDYLWQVDIDEFYKPEDMEKILNLLSEEPDITAISFKQIQFWGGFSSYVDGWYLKRGGEQFHRLFRWETGYKYVAHRPPTVMNERGVELRRIKWLDAYDMQKKGIYLYHYSFLLPKQVIEKSEYYGTAAWTKRNKSQQWAQEVFLELRRPYRVHNTYEYPAWLEPFIGTHPPSIDLLRADLEAGKIEGIELRRTDDVSKLLNSPIYFLGKTCLKIWDYPDRAFVFIKRRIRIILFSFGITFRTFRSKAN